MKCVVFGVRMRRKLTRKGVRVRNIDYQSDALMHMFLNDKVDDLEVLWWDGDIGTISVRAGIGSWMTVSACEERWIGKSELEMLGDLAEEAEADDADQAVIDAERRARRDWINAANRESYRLKRLVGLISLPKTADELEYETQRFTRHTDTAERRHKAGPHRPLLGDLEGTAPTDTTPAANHAQEDTTADYHVQANDNNLTME